MTCHQVGENIYPCNRRNLVYENVCLKCHPGAAGRKPVFSKEENLPPAIYVGETCRSLQERGKEHWKDFEDGSSESHILKHHLIHHGGEGTPEFHLRPVKFVRTALTRQLSEAVRIGRRGEGKILNSKTEYNRSRIARPA